MNPPRNLADQLGSAVLFRGVNVQGKYCFSNGASPLTTHIFSTLEEAVTRFGRRIEIDDKTLKYSTPFQDGYNNRPARTDANASQQERLEWGFGRLAKLLEALPPKTP